MSRTDSEGRVGVRPPGKEDLAKAMERPIRESAAWIEFGESHQNRRGSEQKRPVPRPGSIHELRAPEWCGAAIPCDQDQHQDLRIACERTIVGRDL